MKRICAVALSGAVCCALLGGCTEAGSNTNASASEKNVERPADALTIETVSARKGEFGEVMPGRVTFRPQALAAVNSPAQARVVAVHVSPGDVVSEGAALITLRGGEIAAIRAGLEQAAARAAAAEDLLNRQNAMMAKGVGLEVERFAAETGVREARAELERARRAAAALGDGSGDQFELRAPASGVVTDVRAKMGGIASPDGEALVDIGDPKQLWIVADVPESQIDSIAVGLTGQVSIRAAGATYDAIVEKIGRVIDGEQRRLPVYLALQGPTAPLLSGMQADVRLHNPSDRYLSLPVEAILIKDSANYIVYVQDKDGRLEPRSVTIGASRNGRVIVTHGLQPGEKVVVKGALLLDNSSEQLL